MSGSGSSWGSSSSSESVSVQIVTVSDMSGSLTYSPNMVMAEVGTIVEFHFYPKVNDLQVAQLPQLTYSSEPHSNTIILRRSMRTYRRLHPKHHHPGHQIRLRASRRQRNRFHGWHPTLLQRNGEPSSLLKPSQATTNQDPQVNDTKPIWIYCGQLGHCQKGMSMVINQNMSDTVHTLANYQMAAAMLPVANGTATASPPPAGVAPPPSGQSTSTSTFTAPAFPPPSATTPPAAVTQQPQGVSTSPPSPTASVGTFTGDAVALTVKKMSVAVGMLAMGVAALL